MARPKMIDDNELLQLINDFYVNICKKNIGKLKIPKLTAFIQESGYPSYEATSLRRNKIAREYIEKLKEVSEETQKQVLVSYKTLDINSFIDTNKSRTSLTRSLTELDTYYRTISETALEMSRNYNSIVEKYHNAKNELSAAKESIGSLSESLKESRKLIKNFKQELNVYKKIVSDYIKPGIANEFLIESKLLVGNDCPINTDFLYKNIVTGDTIISFDTECDFETNDKQDTIDNLTPTKAHISKSGSNVLDNIFNMYGVSK